MPKCLEQIKDLLKQLDNEQIDESKNKNTQHFETRMRLTYVHGLPMYLVGYTKDLGKISKCNLF